MKNIVKIIMIVLLIQGCKGQEEKKESMIKADVNYKNKIFQKTYGVVSDKVNNCFEIPDYKTFRNRVLEVYKIDIDKSEFMDIELTLKDYGQVAMKNYKFIIPATSDLPGDPRREKDDPTLINKFDEEASIKICHYNNMIFYNDVGATNWVKSKHPYEMIEIVKEYGYTKNKDWLQFAFSKSKLYEPEELKSFLFDVKCRGEWRGESGDCNTISSLRKDMLDKMIEYGAELSQLSTVANMVSNGKSQMYEEDTEELYAYLMAYCYKAGQSGIIEYLYDTDPKMIEVFRKKDFYGIEDLKDFTDNFYIPKNKRFGLSSLGPDPYIDYGVINDPDGYTNLRDGKGTSAKVIKKIKEGEKFAIETNTGDWWSVVTEDGINGWIHSSRIKVIEGFSFEMNYRKN